MKSVASVLVIILFSAIVSIAADNNHQYVGVQVCSMCHKTDKNGQQFQKWQASKHSQAMKALETADADKIAAAHGVKGKASEAKECIECHQTAYDAPASLLGPKFSKEDGVQCESCHGAGNDYKAMSTMKDKQKAIAAGLTVLSVDDGSAEKLCETCHNKKSPTFKSFDFKKMWAEIAHPVPKQ
ncbi:MAG TPA: cytochrome c family protein [Candidatus Acidoferrales bacterium]|nr:cytochrome c family protein [Candidatus Acidoferrales bacterium]